MYDWSQHVVALADAAAKARREANLHSNPVTMQVAVQKVFSANNIPMIRGKGSLYSQVLSELGKRGGHTIHRKKAIVHVITPLTPMNAAATISPPATQRFDEHLFPSHQRYRVA